MRGLCELQGEEFGAGRSGGGEESGVDFGTTGHGITRSASRQGQNNIKATGADHMTLAVAIKATDAIILAADSRGTIGDPRGLTAVNDTQNKLYQFGRCGLAIAGASELATSLLDELGKRGLMNPQNVDEAVAIFGQAADIMNGWFRTIPPEQRAGVILLLAGYRITPDNQPVPRVYLLTNTTHFAPQLGGNYPMMAGVPQYAVYLSHRYYGSEINSAGAAALAEYLISETASQDPKVGGPVRIAKLTPEAYTVLSDAEVTALKKRNQKLNDKLKRFFMDGAP
jgi:20S proteasome alpha/beta subunit